jgi:uncharacterized protein YdhG (YjbR/CyaY superfamily)
MNKANPTTVDEYIAAFPDEIQERLERLRQTIHKAAPDATETMSYQMPAFKLQGMLVYFAAWKHHIGLYAAGSAPEAFKTELASYTQTKGSIHFPHDEPLPLALVTELVKHRAKENLEKAAARKRARRQ